VSGQPAASDRPSVGVLAPVRLRSARGRGVLAATILGSGMTFLDSTIVNIATDRIGRQFHAGFGALQWVVNAYTLSLAALILLGGSLGDRFGRRRIFVLGVSWFALASLACALAPGVAWLIAARAVQGVGAALMMPGSLAIISAAFDADDAAPAVGIWSGLTGVATAAGPLLGGWLVQDYSWRWAFAINLPLAALVLVLAGRYVPESRAAGPPARPDLIGIVVVAAGLAALTYGTIRAGDDGWNVISSTVCLVGLAFLTGFVLIESRRNSPLVPTELFRDRTFAGTNAMTLLTYGALGVFFFLLVLHLQVVGEYGPFTAGLATLPLTVLLLAFSGASGKLAVRVGPRRPLITGPLLAALGLALTLRIDAHHRNYWIDVLPAVSVFAIGMVFVVAPLTATVMGAAPADRVGIASGVNNAVARAGGLLAVAVIPSLAGLQGGSYRDAAIMTHGYRVSVLCCIGLLVASSLIVAVSIARREVAVHHQPYG
jgi:EmrB/QacA subfamily drug resistance transporter